MTERPNLPEDRLANWRPTEFAVVYQFTVQALEDINSEPCFRIRIDAKTLDGVPIGETVNGITYGQNVEYWRIYLRQSDFTLKRVERLRSGADQIVASHQFEPGPVDVTETVGDLILAIPSFQGGEQSTIEPLVHRTASGERMGTAVGHCRQSEETARIRINGQEKDALKMTLEKIPEDSHSRVTTEIWKKGMPWWTEATYYRDGRPWCWAKLLK